MLKPHYINNGHVQFMNVYINKQKLATSYLQTPRSDCTPVQFPLESRTTGSCCPGSTSQELPDVSVGIRTFLAVENSGHRMPRHWKPARQNPALRDRGTSWEASDLRCWSHSASVKWRHWRLRLDTHNTTGTGDHLVYKTKSVYLCLCSLCMAMDIFHQISTKFGMWHPYTPRMVTGQ